MIELIVGSSNPVKINSVRRAAEVFWKDVIVSGIEVPTLISTMPLSKEETRIGAQNRALFALNYLQNKQKNNSITNIGIGHEGGVVNIHGDWYLFGTTYATDGKIVSWGGETQVRMPKIMIDELNGGMIELGDVIDKMTGEKETKRKGGAIAVLSKNKILREDLFYHPTMQALTAWVHNFEF